MCVCSCSWGSWGSQQQKSYKDNPNHPDTEPDPDPYWTEPNRTEPHCAHSEEVTLDKPLPTGWLQSEYWAWSVAPTTAATTTRTAAMIAKHTHTHTRVGIGTHAHTVKWHVHTYLNMMRNFNFPWLIHMIFDCHIHIVVNLVNLSLDPNSGWLFRLDFMARRPRSGYHIWFIIIVLMLPMCDCNVNQLKTHFVIFVSLSTNSLQMFKCNSNLGYIALIVF